MSTTNLRVVRARARLQAASMTWHYLVDGPDRSRSRQAVEDLHAACAELAAALQDAGGETENGGPDEDGREHQDQADARP